ncbi:T9SS type B sorting domain-containing protein [uncultured Maribacter sp.]|uniref:T9SS type B sorting domain-containing protein n=1 Tax=uncultured Maribacter sp. TaxID=431308 RepID=UPI002631FEFB|nr:T9SS type B sorting domain-containing protein [uncultured Maribacter sp.]
MNTLKSSLRHKKALTLIVLGLVMSSLFGYVLPTIFNPENQDSVDKENIAILANTHPLSGISDNVVFCSNDNRELHEIYLCGATDERLLNLTIPNLKQIIWAKLDDISCSASQNNCPNTSPSCTWNQLATNPQYNVTEGGEYRIFIQYTDNTTERFYFNVYANGLNPNAVVTNIDCGNPGNITVNNVPNSYEYSINNGASWQDSNIFPINTVSTYNIQLRNKNITDGCVFELNDVTVNNNSFNATSTILPITCNTTKGGIKIDLTDASSSYIYEISQGGSPIGSSGPTSSNTYTFTDLNSGDYDINVTLSSVSSCSWTASITVPVFTPIQPNAVVTKNIDCTDGVITVAPTGGTAPYEYSLDGGTTYNAFTSGNQSNIPITTAGAYTVTVKDNSGCEIDSSPVTIITEPEITYTVTPKAITCNGTDDGSITVDITNSQGYSTTYSIDGSTFQTSNVFSNLASGSYTVTIKKEKAGGSCDVTTSSVTVNPSTAFTASASVTQQINCSSGSATIEASVTAGGTAPFEYSTNGVDFQASSTLTGLGAGTYTITVKDANGCTTAVNQTVNGGSNPTNLNFLTSGVDCSTGETDVQITIENGTGPYTYKITAPSTINSPGDTFTALAPGTYTFEVDDNGCKIVRNYTVPEPIQFTANTSVKKHVSCFAVSTADGEVEVDITNFNTSFDVIVENSSGVNTGLGVTGATTSPIIISGLAADTYTIKISDESSPCQFEQTHTIEAPTSALNLDSYNVSDMNCGSPGSITIEASGGWGNYNYSVKQPDNTTTAPQSNKTITGLTQIGTHTIILKDINGCVIDTQTFDLQNNGGPISIVDQSASNYCYSTTTKGELKIDVSGGQAPYFYTVNNGTPTPITGGTFTLNNLTPEDYIIKVIGGNGCETIVADTKIAGQLFALAEITKPLGCGTSPDAVINVDAQEGYPNPDYTFEASTDGGSTYSTITMPFSTSTAATYTFRVTDSKGCFTITDPVTTTIAPTLIPNHNQSPTACGKAGTGSVELGASGGTPPFLYSFNGSAYTTQTVYTNLDAQAYTYGIKDALGCELTGLEVIVGAEAAITADITKTDITCSGTKTEWGNTNITNVQNATGLVTIRLIRVSSPAAHTAGTARYWTYREYKNIDMSNPTDDYDIRMYWPHHFYVEIEDEKGCIYESDLYEIEQPPLPWIQKPETDLEQSCASGATFEIEVGDPVGLVGPFQYRIWPYDENNPPAWREFNDPSNPVLGLDSDPVGFERDLRVSGLLFGVHYAIVLKDMNTGCQRWRSLGVVHTPEAPNNNIDVISTPQSLSCFTGSDGEVKFTIKGAGDNDLDGTQTVSWNIRHTSDRGSVHDSHPWIPSFRRSGTANDGGSGGDIEIDLTGLKLAWYVVEVTTEAGCKSGNRFLIYRPKSKLKLELDQYVAPTCNIGAQIAVTAKGGWDDQKYFNIRNKLDQTGWHEYEYAFVVDGNVPVDADFGPDNFKTITPTAYDGTNNVYQVYVRDGGGCVEGLGTPITITQDPEPIIDTIDVTDRCTSTNELYNVVATLTQPGTNPTNTNPVYIWDGEVTTTATKTMGPGNHTLVVRDENGCSDTQNIHIYPRLVAKSKITKTVDCDVSLDNGEMLASAYGGSGNFEFTISPIPASYASGEETNTTGIFTRLEPGINYIYTVNDIDNTCGTENSPALQLITPVDPQFEPDTTVPVTCFGDTDGKIIIKQIDGVDNLDVTYEYSIDSGTTYQTSNLFDGLAAGSYDVRIRSSKNCVQNLPGIVVGGPSAPVSLTTPTVSAFACTADNKLGMATIETTVSGGTAPYKYSYNSNSFSSIASTTISFDIPYKTISQNVLIDVIDANSCTNQITVTVPAANKVTASITEIQAMNCIDNAEINVIPSGGVGPFEVRELPSRTLINGTGTGIITIPAGNPGTYIYELTDTDTGCTTKVTYEIAPFNTIEVSASKVNDITCHGESNGELSFEVSSFGSGGFSYEIYNVSNTTTPIHSVANSTLTTPISYNLLPAGTFVVIATDNDTGCQIKSEFISIQSPVEALDFTHIITHELTCSPGTDAQVTATPIGGWGSYEFELVDPSIGTPIQSFNVNNVFSGLTSGINYELTIRDANGCDNIMKVITIPEIDVITVNPTTISATNPSCTEANDGEITVVATRTHGPSSYQYILNNETTGVSGLPQISATFSNLLEGDYSVTVVDGYGCDTTTATISLTDPTEIEIDGIISQEPNCDPNSGEITVSASGGVLGTTYEYRIIKPAADATTWSTQQVYSSLAPGTYEFLARDSDPAKHCVSPISVIRTINVVEPLGIAVNDDNTIINCNGEMDAVLIAEATGGLGGYQYQLEVNGTLQGVPQDSGTFEGLGQGSYRILATGGTNCSEYSRTVTISEPTLLTASVANKQDIKCFGEEDGSIEISVNGGVSPYQYIISSSPEKSVNTNLFEELPGDTYTVIVQDANGCEVTVNNIVVDSPTAALDATITRVEDEVCSSDDNGVIEINITGGTAPYEYNLTGPTDAYSAIGSSTLLLDNLDGGFYEIYIKDANDCPFVLVQEVKVGSNLSSEIETINECIDGVPAYGVSVIFDDNTLDTSEIVFDLDDSTPNNPDVTNAQSDANFSNITSGNHTISIVHLGTGCIEVKNFNIEAQERLVLTTKSGGINEIVLVATGGDGNYTYYFDDEVNTTGSMFINHTAVYTAKVIDGKGCETTLEIPMEFIDIEIPNFFTPDGDGNNDTWVFKNVEGFPNLWGAIYDRYGRQVKYFVKQGNWDGSYNNVDLPAGDYWYVIKLNGENDDREFVGHVTIYR